jgi:hypothetical protein
LTIKITTVLRCLDDKFSKFEFIRQSPHHRDRTYYRNVAEGVKEKVGLDIRNVAGVIRIDTPQIGLRFNAVEELVAKFEQIHPALSPSRAHDIACRGTIGFLAESQNIFASFFRKTWNIWKESDIEASTDDFVKHVLNVAQPFWNKYSRAEATLDLLLSDDNAARDLTGADHFRAKRAVAMTFLMKGTEEAMRVAEAKLPNIRNDSYREEFRSWVRQFSASLG